VTGESWRTSRLRTPGGALIIELSITRTSLFRTLHRPFVFGRGKGEDNPIYETQTNHPLKIRYSAYSDRGRQVGAAMLRDRFDKIEVPISIFAMCALAASCRCDCSATSKNV
jgi:hypothetical protein